MTGERVKEEAMSGTAIYGRVLVARLREPEDYERALSCNGCVAPNVSRVLEVGSRGTDGGGGSITVVRLCGECTRRFREVVSESKP